MLPTCAPANHGPLLFHGKLWGVGKSDTLPLIPSQAGVGIHRVSCEVRNRVRQLALYVRSQKCACHVIVY